MGLINQLERLETAMFPVMWGWVLNRSNTCSKTPQRTKTNFQVVHEMYGSLVNFVENIRDDFDNIEREAMEKLFTQKYSTETKRRKSKEPV